MRERDETYGLLPTRTAPLDANGNPITLTMTVRCTQVDKEGVQRVGTVVEIDHRRGWVMIEHGPRAYRTVAAHAVEII